MHWALIAAERKHTYTHRLFNKQRQSYSSRWQWWFDYYDVDYDVDDDDDDDEVLQQNMESIN
jgi:hypothetical protein